MPREEIFRVLLVDDSGDVCRRVKTRIEGRKTLGQLDPIQPVIVSPVLVKLREIETRKWSFDPVIAQELSAACTKKPNLIFVDYGYGNREIIDTLRNTAKDREISPEELQGKLLTPLDLADWIYSSAEIPEPTRRLLVKNFIESGARVYLYSYSSKEFFSALGDMSERQKKTSKAFPSSQVVAIDMRDELYHSIEFDWPKDKGKGEESKYAPDFYAYQTSVLLDYIVHKEVLRGQLVRAKYLRVRRSALSAATLTALGAAIGFAAQWVGSLVTDLLKQGSIYQAIAVGVSLILLLFILGFLSPLVFERLMTNLADSVSKDE